MESNNFLRDAPVKNFCPLCYKLFPSNNALFNHMSHEHSSSYDCRNAMPHNPIIIQASQQQLTDHTINNVYRKPKKNIPNLNRIAAIQNQVKMTTVYHNGNDQTNHNMSHIPIPFTNCVIPNDPRYARLQTPAPAHLNQLNTDFNNSQMHIRNDNHNTQTKAQSNASQFLPSSGHQQGMTPMFSTNSWRPYDTAQHSPAKTIPLMNNAIANDPRYARLQTPASSHLNYLNTGFNNSKMHIRNDYQNTQTKAQSSVVGTTQFLPSSGYQQGMTPIFSTNSWRPYDTAQHSPAKTNPVMKNSTITSKEHSELQKILSWGQRSSSSHRSSDDPLQRNNHQNDVHSSYVGAQNTNSAGHASHPQPIQHFQKPKDIDAVSKTGYMVYYCTPCREKFDNQVDAMKHTKQHENSIEINRQTEVSQRWDATVEKCIKPTQRNTALELPQAPPKIISIAIEDKGPEQQNPLHNLDLIHSTGQHRVDNHTQQSQQSLLEYAKAKNASMSNIRALEAESSLNFHVNTDTELSLRTNQHTDMNKKDENISNINNNAKENKNNSECEAFVTKHKRSYSRLDVIASNEDDGRDSRKNKKYNLDVENSNLHEGLHTESSQLLSSSEYHVNASNNNQNNNKINANENDQKSSNNENHSSSDDDTSVESSSADDTSDDDDNIKEKNLTRDQESKTKKPSLSDRTCGENSQFDSSDFPINHSMLSKIVENCVKELLRPTYNTKEKSKSKANKTLFKCKICLTHLLTEEELREHLDKEDHNRKQIICNECQLKFPKEYLKKHVAKHHIKMRLSLEDFDIVTDLSSTLSDNNDNKSKVGVKKNTDSNNSTNSNNKSYDTIPSALKGRQVKQANKHKNPKSLKNSFETHSSVVKNKKNYKLDENPNTNSSHSTHFIVYKCAECETCFHSIITIDRHKKKKKCCEKCLETVKCDLCPLKFFANSLKKHKTEHHSETASNSIDLVIMGKHNVRTETLTLAKRTNNERGNKVQKINTDAKPMLKLKNKQIATSFAECYKSYSKTIYKCGICSIYFATESAMQCHLYRNKHALTTVKKCSTCKLNFSSVTLERHRYFHHEYLKLKKKSDFTIIIRTK